MSLELEPGFYIITSLVSKEKSHYVGRDDSKAVSESKEPKPIYLLPDDAQPPTPFEFSRIGSRYHITSSRVPLEAKDGKLFAIWHDDIRIPELHEWCVRRAEQYGPDAYVIDKGFDSGPWVAPEPTDTNLQQIEVQDIIFDEQGGNLSFPPNRVFILNWVVID